MPVHYVHAEAVEARRGLQILWNEIYITVVTHWELNLLLPQALGSVIYKIKDIQSPLKKFLVIFFDSLFSFSHSSVCIFLWRSSTLTTTLVLNTTKTIQKESS